MNKCIFLDRDGVLNVERGDYTFLPEDFLVIPGVSEAVEALKKAGYLLVVVTNQAGITKGLYTREQMNSCHKILMEKTGFLIDKIYYSPYHPSYSESLSRKPDTLMIEKAAAKFDIDLSTSWLIGDRCGDMECARKSGIQTVYISDSNENPCNADFVSGNLAEAAKNILSRI